MRIILIMLITFSLGYWLGLTPQIITKIEQLKFSQEMRDSYFKRCIVEGSIARSDGAIEQKWKCKNTTIFLVKRYAS